MKILWRSLIGLTILCCWGCGTKPARTSDQTTSQDQDKISSSATGQAAGPENEDVKGSESETKATEEPPATIVDGPWRRVLSETTLKPFHTISFRSEPEDALSDKAPQLWFESLSDSSPARWVDGSRGRELRFQGKARLRSPWPADGGLRIWLSELATFNLQLSRAGKGALLTFDKPGGERWIAFTTRSPAGDTQPPDRWLYATDGGRFRRTEGRLGGPILIQATGKHIVLSRGATVVLQVPFAGTPEEAILEANCQIQALEIVRAQDMPRPVQAAKWHRIPLEWDQLKLKAEDTLKTNVSGNSLTTDGSGKLSWDTPWESTFALQFRAQGREIEAWLEDAMRAASTSLFVGKTSKDALLLKVSGRAAQGTHSLISESWLRVVFGPTQVRWFVSQDKNSWAEVGRPLVLPRSGRRRFGLTLAGKAKLSDAEWLLPALINPNVLKSASSEKTAAKSQGATGRLLLAGKTDTDASHLLLNLAETGLAKGALPETLQLALFTNQQASLELLRILSRWSYLESDKSWRPFRSLYPALIHSGFSPALLQLHVDDDDLIWAELLQQLENGTVAESLRFVEELEFHHFLEKRNWVRHGISRLLQSQLNEQDRLQVDLAARGQRWREIWRETLDRNAYNVISEVTALKNANDIEGLAKRVAEVQWAPGMGVGVAPYDKQLYVALPTALNWLHDSTPELSKALGRQFQDLAQQRMRLPLQRDEWSHVEFLAILFRGTRSAAGTYRELGDQAFSNGHFALAERRYRAAVASRSATLQASLRDRLQMVGSVTSAAISPDQEIEDVFANDEADQRPLKSRSLTQRTPAAPNQRFPIAQAETSYQVSPADMRSGIESGGQFIRTLSRNHVDWWQNQLSARQHQGVLLLNNRFQVEAWDVKTAKRLWTAGVTGKPRMASIDWVNVPARMQVLQDRVITRLFYGTSPLLAGIQLADGKLVAQYSFVDEHLVSDPLVVQGRLLGLVARQTRQNQAVELYLAEFDAETCRPFRYRRLLQLDGSWYRRKFCQVAAIPGGFVCSLGGVSFRADSEGNLEWIRKTPNWTAESPWRDLRQKHQPPLIVGDQALLVCPGNWNVRSVDLSSGRLRWKRLFPELLWQAGHDAKRAYLVEQRVIRAIDLENGKDAWQAPLDYRPTATFLAEGHIIVAGLTKNSNGLLEPSLRWLVKTNGIEEHRVMLPGSPTSLPALGPILAPSDAWQTVFFGTNLAKPKRTMIRIRTPLK